MVEKIAVLSNMYMAKNHPYSVYIAHFLVYIYTKITFHTFFL